MVCYIDDILITGKSDDEHLQNLREVCEILQKCGVRAKHSKCTFLQPSVEYLGHIVDFQGLYATPSKVRAITEAPVPSKLNSTSSLFRFGELL